MADTEHKFVGFLWSPAEEYWNDIIDDIARLCEINYLMYYDFKSDDESFENAVIKVYETDDIAISTVKNIKIKSMKRFANKFMFFEFTIPAPAYRKKQNGNLISKWVENTKRMIRNKYKSKIDGYIYDIIIHIADNLDQTVEIKKVMNEYKAKRYKHKVSTKKVLSANIDRADMLVRYHALAQYIADPQYDFEFYGQMQNKRVNGSPDAWIVKFKNLIESVKTSGIKDEHAVLCNGKYELIDGSHRLAIHYYYNAPFISVKIVQRRKSDYERKWFEERFDEHYIDIIDRESADLQKYLES